MPHRAESTVPTCSTLVVYSLISQPVSPRGTPKVPRAAPHTDVVAKLEETLPIAKFSPSWIGGLCGVIGWFGSSTRCMAGEVGVSDWYPCSSSVVAGVETAVRGAGRKWYGMFCEETRGG